MKNRQEQAETGVYYAPEDLVGLGGRMLILGMQAPKPLAMHASGFISIGRSGQPIRYGFNEL